MSNEISPRLRWACRRGMLELDILLTRFLTTQYSHLSSEDQALFERLLECEDQDLFEWLTGKRKPADPELKKIIEIVGATGGRPGG